MASYPHNPHHTGRFYRFAAPLLALLAVFAASPAAALTFEIGGEDSRWVYALGVIEDGDTERLFDLVHDQDGVTHVVLQSHGGSVVEAMRLGRLIRSFDMNTLVDPDGYCLSACFFAFAGGLDRGVPTTARLGVHQFSGTAEGESADRAQALAQTLTADLLAYVDEMGLDVGVMAAALRTAPDDMHVFSRHELEQLSIDALAMRMTQRKAPCPFPPGYKVKDPMGLLPECG